MMLALSVLANKFGITLVYFVNSSMHEIFQIVGGFMLFCFNDPNTVEKVMKFSQKQLVLMIGAYLYAPKNKYADKYVD